MKGLCLLWSLVTTVVLGLLFAGIGAFVLLGSRATMEFDSPEVSIPPEVSTPCYYVSSMGTDEKSQTVIEAALQESSVDLVLVEVSAYGEDYVCPQPDGSETREFGAMGISPTLTLLVAEDRLDDTETLGTLIGDTIGVLSTLQLPSIDQLTINFQGDTTNLTQITWTAPYGEVQAYWSAGITGSELYEQGEILE
jgi:hypothetical protein